MQYMVNLVWKSCIQTDSLQTRCRNHEKILFLVSRLHVAVVFGVYLNINHRNNTVIACTLVRKSAIYNNTQLRVKTFILVIFVIIIYNNKNVFGNCGEFVSGKAEICKLEDVQGVAVYISQNVTLVTPCRNIGIEMHKRRDKCCESNAYHAILWYILFEKCTQTCFMMVPLVTAYDIRRMRYVLVDYRIESFET